MITLDVIEEELTKTAPRKPVIQGMLTNLEQQENVGHVFQMLSRFLDR